VRDHADRRGGTKRPPDAITAKGTIRAGVQVPDD
jgi:hypothetical protein